MSYQDVLRGGEVASAGERECASRFDAITQVLSRFKRRFTLLDLGASEGYMSFRAVEAFDCVAVMIEGGKQLEPLCRANKAPRTILLERRVSVEDLEKLASCEHFDVVLALNVLHHFPAAKRALDAVMELGDLTVVETPPPDDAGACGQGAIPVLYEELRRRGGGVIARTPSHTANVLRPMWLFETPKTRLVRSYFDVPATVPLGPNRITSTVESKRIRLDRKGEEREWIPGINLRTYQRLGGVWPSPADVARMVVAMPLPRRPHGDVRPWNMILDGERVHLIDGRDERAIYDDAEGREWSAADVQGAA